MNDKDIEIQIKKKAKSILNASKEMGIKQTTLDTALKRGLRNSTMSTVIKIAEYLNCSIDELIYNKEPLNENYIEISNKIKNRNNEEYKIINNFIDFIDNTKKDLLKN